MTNAIPTDVSVDANAPPPLLGDNFSQANNLPMDTPPVQWSADQAKKVVIQDFNRSAAWRTTNIDPKWQEANETYTAAVQNRRVWDGTQIPRSNLQVHQAFQQVNALIPQVVDAICGSDLDFDVEANTSNTTIGQLLMVRTLMQYQLKSLGKGTVKFQSYRGVVTKLVTDALVLANGVVEWGWDGPRQEQVVNWKRVPEYQNVQHPLIPGLTLPIPTGRQVAQKMYVPQTVSKFFLDPVDLTEFYVDPNTRGSNVQLSDFSIRRKMMTIADIAGYRDTPGFDVPDDKTLYRYSQRKYFTEGDTSRQYMDSQVGINSALNQDQSIDPRLARVEVLRYWQNQRHVWVIGRDHAMWNGENQYQANPFFNWCYVDKPGQFYGFSIPELLRTDQKLIKELLDGRMDELNLILHPPFVSKRGTFRTQSQRSLRPGANWEADDPTKDIQRVEMGNVTQQAFVEVDAAENRGQKKTGVTDLAVLGTPTAGGNSANRTATGVTAQTNASNSRVHGLVATIEDTVLQPMLDTVWTLICMFLDPNEVVKIVGPDGQALQLDPVDILNSDPRFKMKTANNMKMRSAMQNGGLQQLTQFALNPEVMTLIAQQQGKTLDMSAFTEFFMDIYGVKSFTLYREMTPQEQQSMQQRQNQAGQEKMQLQGARLQQMSQDADARDETKIMVSLITALGQAGLLNGVAGLEAPVEVESRRLTAEINGGLLEQPPQVGQ